MERRGVVLKLYGDAQISSAIADGMTKALNAQEIKVVQAEMDRQRIQRSLLRVAVNNTKTDDDYDCLITKSRYDHRVRKHGWLYETALGLVGLVCVIVYEIYDYFSDWNRRG